MEGKGSELGPGLRMGDSDLKLRTGLGIWYLAPKIFYLGTCFSPKHKWLSHIWKIVVSGLHTLLSRSHKLGSSAKSTCLPRRAPVAQKTSSMAQKAGPVVYKTAVLWLLSWVIIHHYTYGQHRETTYGLVCVILRHSRRMHHCCCTWA